MGQCKTAGTCNTPVVLLLGQFQGYLRGQPTLNAHNSTKATHTRKIKLVKGLTKEMEESKRETSITNAMKAFQMAKAQ